MIVPKIQDTTDGVELTRAHRMYGTAPAGYDRVVTFFRGTMNYVCSSHIDSETFKSFGLPISLVGVDTLVSIAFEDSGTNSPLVLDHVQIGT